MAMQNKVNHFSWIWYAPPPQSSPQLQGPGDSVEHSGGPLPGIHVVRNATRDNNYAGEAHQTTSQRTTPHCTHQHNADFANSPTAIGSVRCLINHISRQCFMSALCFVV